MAGEDVRHVFEAMLPRAESDRLCMPCGVLERPRNLDLGMVVRALVISAGTPGGAYQADVLRSYLEGEVPPVARSAFYRWVDEPLERFMAALAERALAYARAPQVDLAGARCGVKDWSSVDSTTVRGRDALREECPGTGEYAAIKGHTVLSVGGGAPVHDHGSPAREHDSRYLTIDASWRGYGRLAAHGDASIERLRACDAHSVPFGIRLKDHWKPKVDAIARGQVPQTFFPGTTLDALVAEDILMRDGLAIEADVQVGGANHPRPLRLSGVHPPKGSCVFLTNRPPRIGPRQVADLARVRWEVELHRRWAQSVHRPDEVGAERPCSLTTLRYASLIASTIAALRAHTHHLPTRPPQAGAPRREAPRHPRRLALPLAVSCQSIAQAFDLQGAEATQRWDKIAALLTHSGTEPNGRRRPSVLDQLRGWKRQPVVRRPSSPHH